jgi:hypothetical protein
LETLDKPDDNSKECNDVRDLPIEKQFTHFSFCEQIKTISPEDAIKLLEELHLLYLNQSYIFTKIAKGTFTL